MQQLRLDTPIGLLTLESDSGRLRAIHFGSFADASLIDAPGVAVEPVLAAAAEQLGEYFEGSRREFDLPLQLPTEQTFQVRAWKAMAEIPYGQTRTYAELAEAAGSPRASRAGGSACATNPLPIVIPCHRIIRSDGSMGNYGGGLDAKRWLLRLEGVEV